MELYSRMVMMTTMVRVSATELFGVRPVFVHVEYHCNIYSLADGNCFNAQ